MAELRVTGEVVMNHSEYSVGMEGWSWDSVNYEILLNAARQPQQRVATHTPPSLSIVSGNCRKYIRMSYIFYIQVVSW